MGLPGRPETLWGKLCECCGCATIWMLTLVLKLCECCRCVNVPYNMDVNISAKTMRETSDVIKPFLLTRHLFWQVQELHTKANHLQVNSLGCPSWDVFHHMVSPTSEACGHQVALYWSSSEEQNKAIDG